MIVSVSLYVLDNMKDDTNIVVIGTLFILLFGMLSNVVITHQSSAVVETAQGSWACTTDVNMCPDGSYVGRVPPYCQFSLCKD